MEIHPHEQFIINNQQFILLKEKKIEVCLLTTVSKLNINSLSDILVYALYNKVDSWQLQAVNPMGRMNRDYILDKNDYKSLSNFINTHQDNCLNILGADNVSLGAKEWNGCQAGISALGVMSNGDIIGCLSMMNKDYIEGNIRKQNLKDIWLNPNAFSYNRKPQKLTGKCSGCKQLYCRGGCKSTNINQGNPNESPYCLNSNEEKYLNHQQ